MIIQDLIADLPLCVVKGDANVAVDDLCDDSRCVDNQGRCLFVARSGANQNGRSFIADAIRQVPETQSRERPLVRNTRYQLPPEQEKIIPDSIVEDQFHEMIFSKKIMESDTREISRWLVRSFAGVSPGVASEIVDRVRGAGWDVLWRVSLQPLRDTAGGGAPRSLYES